MNPHSLRLIVFAAAACSVFAACTNPDYSAGSQDGATSIGSLEPKVSASPSSGGARAGSTEVVRRDLSASWAMSYDSLTPMSRDAELVVVATVSKAHDVVTDSRKAGDVTAILPFTDFDLQIEEILKGSSPSSAIRVHQTGGQVGNTLFEVHDDPLFEIGATYLLFLRSGVPGQFYVLAGPDGRMVVDSDRVYSLSVTHPNAGIDDLAIDGQPLAEVKRSVEAATK